MERSGARWRIAFLVAALGALLVLVHRGLLLPPAPVHMEDQPCAGSTAAEGVPGDWGAFCRYAADNKRLIAAGARPQLVLLGDSIFEDWALHSPGLFGSDWINRGVHGQGTMRLLSRFRGDVVALRPRAVLIEGGINDIIAADSVMSPDQVAAQIESMVDLAEANGIAVILATVPPVDHFAVRPGIAPQPWIAKLNQRIRDLARRRGLAIADLHGALVAADGRSQRPGFSEDGIHPTAAAYALLEPVVRSALAQALAKSEKPGR